MRTIKEGKHTAKVGDRVSVRGTKISGNGTRDHHYDWITGTVEALGWTRPSVTEIPVGEKIRKENEYGLVYFEQERETVQVQRPCYRVNGRWHGKIKKA